MKIGSGELLTLYPVPQATGTNDCMLRCLSALTGIPLVAWPYLTDETYWQTLDDVLGGFGWTLRIRGRPPEGFAIAVGPVNNGEQHAIVVRGGTMVYDPSIRNDGLRRTNAYFVPERAA